VLQHVVDSCRLQQSALVTANPSHSLIATRSLSSVFSDSSYSPVSWWRQRQETKQADKYKEKIKEMAESEVWKVGSMVAELEEAANSWSAKMPGMSNSKEVKAAKSMLAMVQGVISVAGKDATMEDLENMSRTQKLQAALAGQCTVEEINALMMQCETMAMMQRLLRHRHLQGKPTPETPEAVQSLMHTEGNKYMTKTQKERMMKLSKQKAKKVLARK
jgi:hypothetical protein